MDVDGLVAKAETAATREAVDRFGSGDLHVRGHSQRGCCVHVVVTRGEAEIARWRYELGGRIVDDWPRGPAGATYSGQRAGVC